ncbi:MAG: hypothetical protein ABIL49_07465 [candidate division WOR-3 bacterium]
MNLTLYSNKNVYNLNEFFDPVKHAGTFIKKLDGGHFSFNIIYNEVIYNSLKQYGGILEFEFDNSNKEYYYIYPKNVNYKKMNDDKYVEEIEIYAHHIKYALVNFIYFPKDNDPDEIKEKFKLENGYLSQDNIKFCLEKLFEKHMPTIPNINIIPFPKFITSTETPQKMPIKAQDVILFEKIISESQVMLIEQENNRDKMAGVIGIFKFENKIYVCEYYIYSKKVEEYYILDDLYASYEFRIKLRVKEWENGNYQVYEYEDFTGIGGNIINIHSFSINKEKIYFFIPVYELRNYYYYENLNSYRNSYRFTRIGIKRIYFDITSKTFHFDSFLIDEFNWGNLQEILKQGFIQEASSLDINVDYAVIDILMWFSDTVNAPFVKLFRVFYNLNTDIFEDRLTFDRPNQFEVRDVHSYLGFRVEAFVSTDNSKRYDLFLYDGNNLISNIINIDTKEMFRLPITDQDNYSARIIKAFFDGQNWQVFIAITTIKGIGVCKVVIQNGNAIDISWNLFLMENDPKRLEVLRYSEDRTFLLAQTDNDLYICDTNLMNLGNWQAKKVQILPAIKVKLSSKIVYNKDDINTALGYKWKYKVNSYTVYFQRLHPPVRQPLLPQYGIGIPYEIDRKIWEDEEKNYCSAILFDREHPYVWFYDDIETGYSFLKHIEKIENQTKTFIVINNNEIKVVPKYPISSDVQDFILLNLDEIFSVNYFTASSFKQIWFYGFAIQDEPPIGAEDTLMKVESEIWAIEELTNRMEKFIPSSVGIEIKIIGIRYLKVGDFIRVPFRNETFMISEVYWSLPSNTTEIKAIEVKL